MSQRANNKRSENTSERMPLVSLPVCILIADDLTGACDAGVQFACKGLQARVILRFADDIHEGEVLVFTTNSRRDLPAAAAKRIENLIAVLPKNDATLYFKKIDSTLRGNVFVECESMMHGLGCQYAIIAPAYPTNGRVLEKGVLKYRDGGREVSCSVLDLLQEQGMQSLTHIETGKFQTEEAFERELYGQRANGARYVLCDAISNGELDLIAHVLHASTERPLWIGSAGLAEEAAVILAARSGPKEDRATEGYFKNEVRPVLLCVGSDHPATLSQIAALQRATQVVSFKTDSNCFERLHETVRGRKNVLLSVDTNKVDRRVLYKIFEHLMQTGIAAIVMTGGDTAALVCEVAGTHAILLRNEVAPGIPWGYLCGGLFDGLPAITKSGGFGSQSSLEEAVQFLSRVSPQKRIPG
jgi:uncharacterized protein YgbK (DUF1537 family)